MTDGIYTNENIESHSVNSRFPNEYPQPRPKKRVYTNENVSPKKRTRKKNIKKILFFLQEYLQV
jgi:hypothetical protein